MAQITLTMADGTTSKPFDESKLTTVLTKLAKTDHKVTAINKQVDKPVDPMVQVGKQIAAGTSPLNGLMNGSGNLESPVGSFVNGAAQGITGGLVDEGGAGVRTAGKVLSDAMDWLGKNGMSTPVDLGSAKSDIENTFDKQLAMERAKRDLARNANPLTYDAGDLLGGLGAGLIAGKGAPIVNAGSVEGHSDDKASMSTAAKALLAGGITKAGSVLGGAVADKVKSLLDTGGLTGKVLKLVLDHSGVPVTGFITKLSPQLGNVVGSAFGPGEELGNAPLKLTDAQKDELYRAIANGFE